MVRSKIVVFLLAVFLFSFQQTNLVFVRSLPVKATYINVDNLSNSYLVNDDVLQKYDPQGNLMKTYSNKTLGKISAVDANNPMKVILFYRDFLQIVFLDNTLSQNGDPVSIEILGYPQTRLVCSSHDKGFWIYNQQNFELLRFDQNLHVVNQTGNLAPLLGIDLKPNFMIEYNNRLYVNNPETGILVFDVFGTYSKNIPLKKISDFQFREDDIVYYQNGKLNSFNTKTLEQGVTALPDSTAVSVKLTNDKLYLLKKDALGIYTVMH